MNSYSFSNRVQSKREINTPTRSILATFVLFFTSYEKQTKNYGHFLIFFSYFRDIQLKANLLFANIIEIS